MVEISNPERPVVVLATVFGGVYRDTVSVYNSLVAE
jgi:hypothetical protein